MKPDALTHLADALMEDIVATPPHQLAIEEIVDAGRSRELVFRFDDILAEASAPSGQQRQAATADSALWSLTDALCEDIAARPDEPVLTDVSEGRSDDRSLAGQFDDILRRDPHLAMAGLKMPRQSGPSHAASCAAAALARLLDQLIAPLHSRAAAGAFATVATAVLVMAVFYQPSFQTMLPEPFVTASPMSPVAARHTLAEENAGSAEVGYTISAAKPGASPRPRAFAEDRGEMRVAAASREPPPAPAEVGNISSAAELEASSPPAVAADRQQEDARRFREEEERKLAEAEATVAELRRQAEERRRREEALRQQAEEEKRLDVLRRQEEERRLAELRKKQEEEKRLGVLRKQQVEERPEAPRREAAATASRGNFLDSALTSPRRPAAPSAHVSALRPPAGAQAGVKSLEETARGGDVTALSKLGRMYADGDGVPQNHLRAFDYFRRITESHETPNGEDAGSAKTRVVANAFVETGRYALTGIANSDVKPDPERARQLFTRAATELDDPDAQYELGRMYLDGNGAAKDAKQGTQWLQIAATKGQYEAQAAFGSLLFKGAGMPRDGAKGLMWLMLAMNAAPQGETRISGLYNAAWKQATEKERTAALALVERWRNGQGSPPLAASSRPATDAERRRPAAAAAAPRNPAAVGRSGAVGVGF